MVFGGISFVLCMIFSLWVFIQYTLGNTIQGWSSVMISAYFLGAVQLLCVGIIGEYVGKIYREVKKRPRYINELCTLENKSRKRVVSAGYDEALSSFN